MTTLTVDVERFHRRWDELAEELRRQQEFDPTTARDRLDDMLAELDNAWTPPEEPLPEGVVLLAERGDRSRGALTGPAMVHRALSVARVAIVVAILAILVMPWLTVLIFRTVHW